MRKINDKAKHQRIAARQEAQRLRREAQAEVWQRINYTCLLVCWCRLAIICARLFFVQPQAEKMKAEAEAQIEELRRKMLEEARAQIQAESEDTAKTLQNKLSSNMRQFFSTSSQPLF